MSKPDKHSKIVSFALFGTAIIIVAFGSWLGIRAWGLSAKSAAQEPPDAASAFVRQGDKIVIPDGSPLRSRLKIEPVSVKNNPHVIMLPGVVEADPARTVNILTPVAGKVVKLDVQLGDQVKKGQSLAVIDSGDLALAYADDDKARSVLKRTKFSLERVRAVHESGGGPLKDVQLAEDDYAQAEAEFNRAEARLKEIGVSPDDKSKSRLLMLKAPITGTVTTLTTATGAFANDVTASLMMISNLDSIWVTAMTPESDIAFISKDQSVDVTFAAYPNNVLHGKVSFVSALVEPDTRRTKVRIAFDNPDGKLKPNMFATVKFYLPQNSCVVAPESALLMNNDRTTILVEIEPWTFVRRAVTPGYGDDEGVRIEQGLMPGDRIIVKGGVLLND